MDVNEYGLSIKSFAHTWSQKQKHGHKMTKPKSKISKRKVAINAKRLRTVSVAATWAEQLVNCCLQRNRCRDKVVHNYSSNKTELTGNGVPMFSNETDCSAGKSTVLVPMSWQEWKREEGRGRERRGGERRGRRRERFWPRFFNECCFFAYGLWLGTSTTTPLVLVLLLVLPMPSSNTICYCLLLATITSIL